MCDCVRGNRRLGGSVISVIVAALCLVAASTLGFSQPEAPVGQHVTASLVGETHNIVPGRPFQLALRQQIQPGWHTYWSNPGESGLPTVIEWSLPQGFRAGSIAWPTPERFTAGPVVGYGYKDEILLPVTIEAPADVRPGNVLLSARVSWLVCSDICIPEEAELSISVPVGTASEPDPNWTDAFASTRARTPRSNPFPTTAVAAGDEITLRVATGDATQLQEVAFFPADANVIDDGATQLVAADAEGLRLTLRRDKTQPVPAVVNGVLTFRDTTAQVGGALNAIVISSPIAFAPPDAAIGLGFVAAVLFGVLGGLVLNLMPYVLPVLSIKVLALIEHSGLTPREMRLQGVVYAAGVLVSFTLLGGALLGLRAAGAEIGWGFQLQSPVFVATMVYLLFAVGLNLSGVFSIGNRMAGVGGDLASRPGYSSAFFTGALATLVATPCTAPFMAAAIGYAVTQPWYASLAVLEAIGLGLALPYVAITVSPRARRLLPKPGIWMLRLKEVVAFPVYGTTVWLVYVLSQLADAFAVTAVLTGLVLIGFATWLHGAAQGSKGAWRNGGLGLSTLAAVGAVALLYLVQDGGPAHAPQTVQRGGIQWQPFSGASLEALRAEGRPVLVDFTASWCITCKVNERIALADPAVVNAFANGGIVALKADWTRHDASITQMLEANGHAGVPLYLLYRGHAADGASKPPIVLPQLLTVSSILRALQED